MYRIDLNGKQEFNRTIVTIGKFDGIHKGHKKLLEVMKENAHGRQMVVLTFEREPKEFLKNHSQKTIVTEQEKQLLFKQQGVDAYFRMPLTEKFLSLTPEQFLKEVLIHQLRVQAIVCGPDFCFGKNALGDVEFLRRNQERFGYRLIVIKKEQYCHKDISSSEIRKQILDGNMSGVQAMLGSPYFMIGTVVKGKQLGKKLGFPTANIIPEETKLLPPNGVYRTQVDVEGSLYRAITNVGVNPTVEHSSQVKVESHLADFGEDLYGKIIKVFFYERIRPEMRFTGEEELRRQIQQDLGKL